MWDVVKNFDIVYTVLLMIGIEIDETSSAVKQSSVMVKNVKNIASAS